MVKICTSCGVDLEHEVHVSFLCPNCGEERIYRCRQCRQQGNRYKCGACSFEGP